MDYILTGLIFTPLLVAAVLLCLPNANDEVYKILALLTLGIETVLAVILVVTFDCSLAGYGADSLQFAFKTNWMQLDLGGFGQLLIQYYVAVDGLSVGLVLLSAIVMLVGGISSLKISKNVQGYFVLYLVLTTSVMGCFMAVDLFLFYLFFEFMLLPMYFLIGIWGGKRREYASIKFFIYTLVGSLLILMVLIGLGLSVVDGVGSSIHTFDLMKMLDPANYLPMSVLSLDSSSTLFHLSFRSWAFILLIIGFAIKLPTIPVHTWLPDAHVEAPTSVSIVLAGVLLKIGGYGIFRIGYAVFPEGALMYGWWIGLIGAIAIVYAAFVAMAQSDLKRLIAYSSVSHMGFVLLGVASLSVEGASGALLQMFSHGIISALLFLIVGVIYDRTSNKVIGNFSGLASKMPQFTVVVVLSFFAALGLPGFSSFIAEFLVLVGAFNAAVNGNMLNLFMPILGLVGLVLGAAYFVWTIQRMFFGKYWVSNSEWQLLDLTIHEWLMIVPLILLTLLFGVFPHLLLDLSNLTLMGFVTHVVEQGNKNMALLNQIIKCK